MFLLCLGVAMPLLAIGSFSLFKEYRTLKLEAQRATTLQAATGVRTLGNWISGQLTSIDQVANLLERQNLSTSNEEIQKTLSTAIVSQPAWQKLILVDSAGKRQFAAVQSGKSADNKIVTSDLAIKQLLEMRFLSFARLQCYVNDFKTQ